MKFNFKFILTTLLIMFAANLTANAGTIGYADFGKVVSEYSFARNAYKDIDNKMSELQQYVFDKEKQWQLTAKNIMFGENGNFKKLQYWRIQGYSCVW